jgi:hypothetical protein
MNLLVSQDLAFEKTFLNQNERILVLFYAVINSSSTNADNKNKNKDDRECERMQVNHLNQTQSQPERSVSLREGDVYNAVMKERRDNQEAVLHIRGREVVAKFEGKMPQSDRMTIQIHQIKDDVIRVRTVSEEPLNGRAATTNDDEHSETIRWGSHFSSPKTSCSNING